MAGVVAASPFDATFVGDASLSRRPMRRVARPLEAMGARVELPPHGGLPMTIHGGALHEIDWTSEVASAQVKSAILLAALVGRRARARRPSRRDRAITPSACSRRAARRFDVDGTTVDARRRQSRSRALDTDVPGDPSSAAFFAGLAALARRRRAAPRGRVRERDAHRILSRVCATMGVEPARREPSAIEGGESVADLVVAPSELRARAVTRDEVPSMVDELPLLACLAARAEGETRITGANELRVKESDRIAAVVANLRAIGVDAEELPDGMRSSGRIGRCAAA